MKKIIIYTDGGSRGNPGPSGIGVVICDEKGEIVKEYGEVLGVRTNNEAEYEALIFGMKKVKARYGAEALEKIETEVRSDSELMIKQLNGEYKVQEPKIQPLFLQAWNLKIDFGPVKFTVIPREKNKEADRLVNEALDNQARAQTLF